MPVEKKNPVGSAKLSADQFLRSHDQTLDGRPAKEVDPKQPKFESSLFRNQVGLERVVVTPVFN